MEPLLKGSCWRVAGLLTGDARYVAILEKREGA
jgi:hypothetical protein